MHLEGKGASPTLTGAVGVLPEELLAVLASGGVGRGRSHSTKTEQLS